MKNLIISCFFTVLTFSNFAQKQDNLWVLGYNGAGGNTFVDFTFNPPDIYEINLDLNMRETNASICDENGNLLFYSNGGKIFNNDHEIIQNGSGLNPSTFGENFEEFGYTIQQAAIFLPHPSNDSLFYLFHSKAEYPDDEHPAFVRGLYYSLIDKNGNNGLGNVIEKNQLIIEDSLTGGKVVATKHANGQDWWLVVPEYGSYRYHTVLVTADTIIVSETENLEPGTLGLAESVGYAAFSPDGNKYVRHDLRFLAQGGNTVDIYDFDRCTGALSNNIHVEMGDTTGPRAGAIFSQNSRFLYTPVLDRVYQFDMWASDIAASKTIVAEYDGYMSFFDTRFNSAILAPDGKIYITTQATDNILHRINLPNHLGIACDVEQHAITLPTLNDRSLPNYPNFRLGPIDGSPCDTLSLDNHPLAGFTWEVDSFAVVFSDNSYYHPTDWFWDFGDTGTATDPNPSHAFSEEGIYDVCLIVSNENSSDTICQPITISTLKADFSFETDDLAVSFSDASLSNPLTWHWDFGDNLSSDLQHPNHIYSEDGEYEVCLTVTDEWAVDVFCDSVRVEVIDDLNTIDLEQSFQLFPNPVSSNLMVLAKGQDNFANQNLTIQITDILGKIVLERKASFQNDKLGIDLDVSEFPSGTYFLKISGEDVLGVEKFVKE